MAGSQTLSFDIVGDAASATRAFKATADGAALAARGVKQLSEGLAAQSKTAQVSADATLALAKSDDLLRDAEQTLAGATDDASSALGTLRKRLDDLSGKVATARVALAGDKDAQAALDKIDVKLIDLDHKTADPSISVQGFAKATAELSAVDLELDKIGGKGGSAENAAFSLGSLGSHSGAIAAVAAAGTLLSPVLVTTGVGFGGLAAAAAQTVTPILSAGTATKQAQQALASLDPAQKAAYGSLSTLKSEFGAFSKELEPDVLGVFNAGLKTASGLLADVEPVAAATGKAFGSVLSQVDAEFQSKEWQNFFQFMAQTAGPDVQQLGNLFIDLTDDLPPLLEELQPVATALLGVVDGGAKLIGVLNNMNPALSNASVQSARTQQSTGGLLGSLEHLIGLGKSVTASVTGIGNASTSASTQIQAAATAQQGAATASANLSTNLTTLEAKYGLTASQTAALVKAAGQTNAALSQTGTQGTNAEKAVEGYANASLKATSPTQQLAGDVATLNTNVLGATAQLNAFTNAWDLLVGNSVSDQQAVLTTSQAFAALVDEIKKSGASSLTSQNDFLSYISSIGQGLQTLEKNGASVKQVNDYYQTNIQRLQTLHNLTPAQQADIAGLVKDYNTWASSTAGLNSNLLTAAQSVKDKFTANLKALGEYTPTVNTDVNNLANAVQKTGSQSSATEGARAKLIADLKQAGVDGKTAATDVDGLQTSISKLKGKTVTVGVTATASGSLHAVSTIPGGTSSLNYSFLGAAGRAAGGMITGGTPGKDSVLGLLMPGEVVVPTAMVKAGAVDHLRGKLPGFAAGGGINLAGPQNWVASTESTWGTEVSLAWAQAAEKQFQAAASAAAAAITAAGVSNASAEAALKSAAAKAGWTGAQWTALYDVEMREAGFNLTATNPTSGAYGMAQFINGPSEYAQYGGNATTAAGQAVAMVNYIKQRYGTPEAAWQHELNYGWYDQGGALKPGLTLAYNGTGRPEMVIPNRGSGGGGPIEIHLHNHGVIGSQAEVQRWFVNTMNEAARSSQLRWALTQSPSSR